MQHNQHPVPYRLALAVPLLLMLAVLLSDSHPIHAQTSEKDDRQITFVRLANGEPGGEGVYVINADGTDERPLFLFEDIGLAYDVYNGGYRCPVWSPNGRQLAFNGTDEESSYLAVVDVEDEEVNSSDVERVYEVLYNDQTIRNVYFPQWVPDANALSFGYLEAERNTGRVLANGIQTVSLDDGEIVTLVDDLGMNDEDELYIGGPVPNYEPFAHGWSPDGSQIAVTLYNWQLYVLDADGSNRRELPIDYAKGDVAWSPDGSKLASSLYRLTLIDPDDGTEQELLPMGEMLNSATNESIAWSPDGQEIAYSTMWSEIVDGVFKTEFSVSVVDVETAEVRELLRTPTFDWGAYPYNVSCVDWRPSREH